jgi:hypothetical protein
VSCRTYREAAGGDVRNCHLPTCCDVRLSPESAPTQTCEVGLSVDRTVAFSRNSAAYQHGLRQSTHQRAPAGAIRSHRNPHASCAVAGSSAGRALPRTKKIIMISTAGRVAEWFKAAVLKTARGASPSWVRIPPLPFAMGRATRGCVSAHDVVGPPGQPLIPTVPPAPKAVGLRHFARLA